MIIEEKKESQTIFGQEITISTGYLAKQANGSVTIQCGNTILLATATMAKKDREGIDFFPLMVEFAEKMLNEAGVAMVPGSAFGTPGYMRLSFATSMETLEDAVARLTKALS